MTIAHDDPYVGRLFDRIALLVVDGEGDPAQLHAELVELTLANAPDVARYWKEVGFGTGVPDSAYKDGGPHLFPDAPVVREFRTSGTTGSSRGLVRYTGPGLALKGISVAANARLHISRPGARPAVILFGPAERDAPHMAIAFDMARILETVGDPDLSLAVVGPDGVDYDRLAAHLDLVVAEGRPAVLLGASFGYVNVCDELEARGLRWDLPAGSRMYDGGGFKGRSRVMRVDELRDLVGRVLGVREFDNMFGMTELATQFYDAVDRPVGPLGERPKIGTVWSRMAVRDPATHGHVTAGRGLLEITDLCLIDRPHVLLTGDVALAGADGVALAGRVAGTPSRGCSLSLDEMTAGTVNA
ncbi:coenzyme F390 synthetase [Saccharothrix violaceirubra]|uniref:Acyl-protein synthetase LuxE n=1 Tax=Saccharothrix violaceirubra TaxID=413306 RepID=A0A7W7WW44_9PSEU|nr:acyl-CoA reductase [Saccharothrix violaceirubra]MBB4965990.1 hypothetical protein [Saccharothrix violaceirubra]